MPHDRSYAAMQREKNCIFANMYTLQNTQKKFLFFWLKPNSIFQRKVQFPPLICIICAHSKPIPDFTPFDLQN